MKTVFLRRAEAVSAVLFCLACCAAFAGTKVGHYFRETQNLPSHTGREESLPFAYYPSVNKLDVAIQLTEALIDEAGGTAPEKVIVVVRDKNGEQAATGEVPLNEEGYGRALIDLPDLPDGEYRVEYAIGEHEMTSPKTFKRTHFPFEKTDYGAEHKVYPPFIPVKVDGASIEVVGRKYKLNGFCLFDSVESLGRELLASPITLVGETTDGKEIIWSGGKVSGEAAYEDEAIFKGTMASPQIEVESQAVIQEDGCAEALVTPETGVSGCF